MPAATPVTIPEEPPTVATGKLPLLQLPPGVALLKVIVLPWHTVVAPVIGSTVVTVRVKDVVHPAPVV